MKLNTPITSVMTENPHTVFEKTNMTEVAKVFDSKGIHHLPVVSEDSRLVGLISHRDYCQLQHHFTRLGSKVASDYNDRFFSSLIAKEVMTKEPITLEKTNTILEALDLFLENRFQSVVVVEEGKCIGIITIHDLLKYFKKHLSDN